MPVFWPCLSVTDIFWDTFVYTFPRTTMFSHLVTGNTSRCFKWHNTALGKYSIQKWNELQNNHFGNSFKWTSCLGLFDIAWHDIALCFTFSYLLDSSKCVEHLYILWFALRHIPSSQVPGGVSFRFQYWQLLLKFQCLYQMDRCDPYKPRCCGGMKCANVIGSYCLRGLEKCVCVPAAYGTQ